MPTAHARTEAAPREGGGGQVSLVTRAQEVAEDLKPSSVVQREDGAGGDWRPWQSRICPSTGTTTLRCRGGAQLRIIKVKTSKKINMSKGLERGNSRMGLLHVVSSLLRGRDDLFKPAQPSNACGLRDPLLLLTRWRMVC